MNEDTRISRLQAGTAITLIDEQLEALAKLSVTLKKLAGRLLKHRTYLYAIHPELLPPMEAQSAPAPSGQQPNPGLQGVPAEGSPAVSPALEKGGE